MKKKLLFGLLVIMFAFGGWSHVQASELRGFVKQFTNEQARSFIQQPNGRFSATQPNWYQAAYLNGVGVTIQSADGTVVYNGVTAHSSPSGTGGYFVVPNLPVGTYTITLTSEGLTPLPFASNATIEPSMVATVTFASESDVKTLNWILASQSKRILSLSKRGTLPGGSVGADQNGEPVNFRVWYQGGEVASLYTQGGINYVYFKGALYNDTIGLYSSVLTEPTLSTAEKKYGWEFKGWRINQSDEIYSSEEVGNTRITTDVTLEAVFEAPKYTLTFATDEEKGTLNGQAVVNYSVEGNGTTVTSLVGGTLPTVTAKEGYTFLGWYVDHTTNLVDDATILASDIKKDLVFYAKYKKNAPAISIGANGNWFIDGVDTGKPSQGPAGQNAQPLTITATGIDAAGNTVVTFSDGSKVTIKKGQDAPAPNVEIGANGNWFVNGVDTGKPSQGTKGQDGQSLIVQKTELDANGNTLVTFSDGTTITIHKGPEGQAPRIHIGANGNWYINDVDTGKPAQGDKGHDGQSVSILETKIDKDGNTLVVFTDGSQVSIHKGQDGKDGKDGVSPVITINGNGYWVINGVETKTKAQGEAGRDGQTPSVEIGSNGNWIVNGKDTGVPAKGVNGQNTQIVASGQTPSSDPVSRFVEGILPATGSNQNILLLMVLGSSLLLFGGYMLGRNRSKQD